MGTAWSPLLLMINIKVTGSSFFAVVRSATIAHRRLDSPCDQKSADWAADAITAALNPARLKIQDRIVTSYCQRMRQRHPERRDMCPARSVTRPATAARTGWHRLFDIFSQSPAWRPFACTRGPVLNYLLRLPLTQSGKSLSQVQ